MVGAIASSFQAASTETGCLALWNTIVADPITRHPYDWHVYFDWEWVVKEMSVTGEALTIVGEAFSKVSVVSRLVLESLNFINEPLNVINKCLNFVDEPLNLVNATFEPRR